METPSHEAARAELINRTIGLSTLEQIREARHGLAEWLRAHPGDHGIRNVDAGLARQEAELLPQSPASFAYLTTAPHEPLPPGETVTGDEEPSVAGQA